MLKDDIIIFQNTKTMEPNKNQEHVIDDIHPLIKDVQDYKAAEEKVVRQRMKNALALLEKVSELLIPNAQSVNRKELYKDFAAALQRFNTTIESRMEHGKTAARDGAEASLAKWSSNIKKDISTQLNSLCNQCFKAAWVTLGNNMEVSSLNSILSDEDGEDESA